MSILDRRSATPGSGGVDDRDRRALTERMIAYPEAPGLFRVWSESREYLVDAKGGACECSDSTYRNPAGGCKHLRRVRFATGARDIPAGVPAGEIDPLLGEVLRSSQ